MDFIEHDSLVPFCRHAEVVFVEYGALALLDDSPGVGIVPAEVQISKRFADSRQSMPKRSIFRFGITKAEYVPFWKREF